MTANIAPGLCARMHRAWREGDLEAMSEARDRLGPLHRALFLESSPAPVKYGAELLGKAPSRVRLPLVEPGDATKQAVRDAMVHAGILN